MQQARAQEQEQERESDTSAREECAPNEIERLSDRELARTRRVKVSQSEMVREIDREGKRDIGSFLWGEGERGEKYEREQD
eukprot:1089420-Pleurochrysis_carterae.AAC.1